MTDIIWDQRPLYVYVQTPKERFEPLAERNDLFVNSLSHGQDKDPVNVYLPFRKAQIDEINLIREVSQVLQAKKEEDMKKSQAAAEEAQQQEKETETAAEVGQNETEPTEEKKD